LINSIPHTVQGVSGNRFQTPFASPPGVGESSAILNVIWGLANFTAGGVCCTRSFRRNCRRRGRSVTRR
jgi:hypothetical protein